MHGRKAGEVLLSSLFLCPKTVPSKSEILSAALITFWMETVLSTACRQECSWWGCWEPKAWFVIGVGPFQMNHLDIVHLSLIDNCCNLYLQNLVSLFCFFDCWTSITPQTVLVTTAAYIGSRALLFKGEIFMGLFWRAELQPLKYLRFSDVKLSVTWHLLWQQLYDHRNNFSCVSVVS